MKVKELIQKLLEQNQEADVYFSFNGCTNSGEMLNPTDISNKTFFLCNDEDDELGYICYSSSEYDIPDNDSTIKDRKEAVCIHSNRSRYDAFNNYTVELDEG